MGLAERWQSLVHYLGEVESGAAAQVSARMAVGDANYIEWEGRRKQVVEILRQCDTLAMTYPVDDYPPPQLVIEPNVEELAVRVAEVLAGRQQLPAEPVPPSPFESFDTHVPAATDAEESFG